MKKTKQAAATGNFLSLSETSILRKGSRLAFYEDCYDQEDIEKGYLGDDIGDELYPDGALTIKEALNIISMYDEFRALSKKFAKSKYEFNDNLAIVGHSAGFQSVIGEDGIDVGCKHFDEDDIEKLRKFLS